METVERLKEMALFDDMSEAQLSQWAQRFRRERYKSGNVVFDEGDRAMAFYVIDQGQVRVFTGTGDGEVPVAYFYEGDYFGETGLLTGQPRNATVQMLVDTDLLVLDKPEFDQLLEAFPSIREKLSGGTRREETGHTRFAWQQANEATVFFGRKHWIALLRALRFPLTLGLIGLLATYFYIWPSGLFKGPGAFVVLMLVAGSFLAASFFFTVYSFFDWRNDHYIITNLRVLHVERVLLLRETRDEAPIDRVQDIQYVQGSFLANVLNYGDVLIQTAAATERIVFKRVPRPDQVRDALFTVWQHVRRRTEAGRRKTIREELRRYLELDGPQTEDESETEQDQQETAEIPEELTEESMEFTGPSRWIRDFWGWIKSQFTFQTWLISDEGNTITWRKTGWILIRNSLVPFFISLIIMGSATWLTLSGIVTLTVPLALMAFLIVIFGWWIYIYWDWQNDVYIISGDRLVDLKRRPLFLEELRRETTLDRVENIGLYIPGPIAQLLNYGTVVIETAGEIGGFRFEHVHAPRLVQQEVFNRLQRFRRQEREAEQKQRYNELAEWFREYDDLRQEERTAENVQE